MYVCVLTATIHLLLVAWYIIQNNLTSQYWHAHVLLHSQPLFKPHAVFLTHFYISFGERLGSNIAVSFLYIFSSTIKREYEKNVYQHTLTIFFWVNKRKKNVESKTSKNRPRIVFWIYVAVWAWIFLYALVRRDISKKKNFHNSQKMKL